MASESKEMQESGSAGGEPIHPRLPSGLSAREAWAAMEGGGTARSRRTLRRYRLDAGGDVWWRECLDAAWRPWGASSWLHSPDAGGAFDMVGPLPEATP